MQQFVGCCHGFHSVRLLSVCVDDICRMNKQSAFVSIFLFDLRYFRVQLDGQNNRCFMVVCTMFITQCVAQYYYYFGPFFFQNNCIMNCVVIENSIDFPCHLIIIIKKKLNLISTQISGFFCRFSYFVIRPK